jgi:3-hydroxybutyryl-CoA dehydrogenase
MTSIGSAGMPGSGLTGSGVAALADLDTAMRLGAGYPMGPLTLTDFVGRDTLARIGEIMFEEYREARNAAPPLLKRMVTAGRLGRKSGRGFYDSSVEPPVPGDFR